LTRTRPRCLFVKRRNGGGPKFLRLLPENPDVHDSIRLLCDVRIGGSCEVGFTARSYEDDHGDTTWRPLPVFTTDRYTRTGTVEDHILLLLSDEQAQDHLSAEQHWDKSIALPCLSFPASSLDDDVFAGEVLRSKIPLSLGVVLSM
jgi:hypothetical protein